MHLIICSSDCRIFKKRVGLIMCHIWWGYRQPRWICWFQFDQNAFASAGSSPSPPLLLLPPLRPGGEAGQQMAGPYPSASDEWRMMSSRAWQAPVSVHKGGLSFWGQAAGSLPIFKSAWQIFNGRSWIYVSDDFYLTPHSRFGKQHNRARRPFHWVPAARGILGSHSICFHTINKLLSS